MTARERILKAKGYTYDCGAPDHYSAVLKAQTFRRQGYFATIVTEQRNGITYYCIYSKKKLQKGIDRTA